MTREDERDMACTNWICSQENGTVIMARNVWKAAVEWADQHPQWIPVEERLPEKDGKYLFYDEVLGHEVSIYYDGVTLVPSVTHWMPLPAAPVTHWMEIVPPRKEE